MTKAPYWGSARYPTALTSSNPLPPIFFFFLFFFTASSKCVNDIWQKFPCAGSVARKVLASLYQSIWLMFPCLELPLDGNLLRASLANWNQISSTAWCDIDPYSTPRLRIDQYWFTIKNTPLLVQHCNRYFKAKERGGEKMQKEEKQDLHCPAGIYIWGKKKWGSVLFHLRSKSLCDQTLTTLVTPQPLQWSSPAM